MSILKHARERTYRGCAIASAILACAGCSVHKPIFQTYRLSQQGAGQVLIPPGVASPDVAQRTFAADVTAGPGACASVVGAVGIRVRNKRIQVTVRRDFLVRQPPGWLGDWTAELESQGCLAAGEGPKLADRIAESLPLGPNMAFHLLHSSVLDFDPRVRLQLVRPILREGAAADAPTVGPVEHSGNGATLTVTAKSTADLIGYEKSWYAVQPKAKGSGFTIVPLYAERLINGVTERLPQSGLRYLQFGADAGYYRMFQKAGETEFTQFVIAAPTRTELERRSAVFEAGTASCDKVNSESCVAIPRAVAVNLLLPVTVNGAETMVRRGATLGEALRGAGAPRPDLILPQLAVERPYHGQPAVVEFDRTSPAILDLLLIGGEIISWRR